MPKRAGVTKRVTISVTADDLAVLRARAKRFHGGNVSAVIAELIADLKRQEAWAKALAWYGKPMMMSDAERVEIDRQILGAPPRKVARKRRTG